MSSVLGISAFYHDSAAAVVKDGILVAAAQEERFSRIKHDAKFPLEAVRYCLSAGNCKLSEIDAVVFYEKPLIKFERLLETYLAFAPAGFKSFATAMPVWLKEKLFQKSALIGDLRELDDNFDAAKLLFSEHHLSHAASAFYPSPFSRAAILTMDGVGEWCTTSLALGSGSGIETISEIRFPHSIGLLYSAFTYYLGFKVNSGEYKVMGLAPYGEPVYVQKILDNLIDVKHDGSFFLNQVYFDYCTGLTMTNRRFAKLFGRPARKPNTDLLEQFHMDLAASLQAVTEMIVLALAKAVQARTGERSLCLAGGVALNCVANGKLHRAGLFDDIWIQPAAGDAGGAVGAAYVGYHSLSAASRASSSSGDGMSGSLLGPEFDRDEIRAQLVAANARFREISAAAIIEETAAALSEGAAVGWMQGRMEFGPRSLGARSILADPRSPTMQKNLNLKVKYRESFRPFAPSVLNERATDWFDFNTVSPYMLMTADVLPKHRRGMTGAENALFGIEKLNVPRSSIPAVTHVDYSARLQTVSRDVNPKFYDLIAKFEERTGVPVLVNTSFNVRGEPIVCTPLDAYRCFMGTDLDLLIIGDFILKKADQDPNSRRDYSAEFELD